MGTGPASAEDTAPLLEPRRLTVEEYHRMIEAGILDEDEHVELLEGVIVEMSPHGGPHARCIQWLNRFLVRTLGDDFQVRPQLPLTLGKRNEPEPDLAVVTAQAASEDPHPSSALLVIEVAGSSLRLNRRVKGPIYARAAIAEYWIVNVEARVVEVFSDPDPVAGAYRRASTVTTAESLVCETLPQVSLRVSDLFR
jgi:Uma2 family endonuclease